MEFGQLLSRLRKTTQMEASETPTTTLAPRLAATYIFDILTEDEHGKNNVREFSAMYPSEDYEPEQTANQLLTRSGFTLRWYTPGNTSKERALDSGLKAVFGIELGKGVEEDIDQRQEFVKALGVKIQNFT